MIGFFKDLESHGYNYPNAESNGFHIHMPDGTPRYFPAIHRKIGEYIKKDEIHVTMIYRHVTTEVAYGHFSDDTKLIEHFCDTPKLF